MRSYFSKGGKLGGLAFIAKVQEFSATNTEFGSEETNIRAKKKAEFLAGTNESFSHTQSVYKGEIWNKFSVKSEKHKTNQPCTFLKPINVECDDVTIELPRGSSEVTNVKTNKPINYVYKDDYHHSESKSQESLSIGAASIIKIAVAAGMIAVMPVGVFGTGTFGTMATAGFGSLCSDMSISLIENKGDLGRAVHAMGKNGAALNVAKAMITAGLVKEFGDAVGVKTGFEVDANGKLLERTITDYAKQAAINSSVNVLMAIAEGQNAEDAVRYGLSSMAMNTMASWGAGQIGDMYKPDAVNRINFATHKVLHTLLGAGLGSGLSVINHSDPAIGAASGALGALVATTMTEMLKPDLETEMKNGLKQGLSEQELKEQFMEKAKMSAKWGDLIAAKWLLLVVERRLPGICKINKK